MKIAEVSVLDISKNHFLLKFYICLSLVTSDTELCWAFAKNPRPLRLTKKCNDSPCPAHWLTGPWQFCPVTCKTSDAPLPLRRRSVMCLDQNDIVVPDDKCNPFTRPTDTEYCEHNLPECSVREKFKKFFI